jgi:large subunit ribosomal protein L4
MPKVTVYNLKKEGVGEIKLADEVFGAEVNEALFYEIVKAQLASRRAGTANTKTRSEVTGSTKKIYKQKGMGQARHGDMNAPQFKGGAVALGPKTRSFAYRPPRKMRVGALCSALSMKLRDGQLVVVDDFKLNDIKTKKLAEILGTLEVNKSTLIVDDKENQNLRLSARNLEKHSCVPPEGVNVYDLLRHEHVVLTKRAVEALQTRCKE